MVNKWIVIEGVAMFQAYCLVIVWHHIKFLPFTLPISIIFHRVEVLFYSIGFWVVLALSIALIGGFANWLGYLED